MPRKTTHLPKILSILPITLFTLLFLSGITITIIEKTTGDIFFINEHISIYGFSPDIMICGGLLGIVVIVLLVSIIEKRKAFIKVISSIGLVITLFAFLVSMFSFSADRHFYYESSPDGKHEIVVYSYQFLIAGGGEVFYRDNPLFVRRLSNEENKHTEYFYDDYEIEWYENCVKITAFDSEYTYPLPDK